MPVNETKAHALPWKTLPVWPGTTIPPRLPLSSFRDALFRVAGGEPTSRAGRVVSQLEAAALILYVLFFVLASLPDFRERTPGSFGASPVPAQILVYVEFSTSLFFLLLFVARLCSVTAVPGRREALIFALEALEAAHSGSGSGEAALLEGARRQGGGRTTRRRAATRAARCRPTRRRSGRRPTR